MKETAYDVVIVGSGIAGSVMARVLTTAGKKVLLLEAGLHAGIAMEHQAAYDNYMGYLDQFYKADAKVPNSPYPVVKAVPTIDVLDINKVPNTDNGKAGYLVQLGPLPFASDSVRSPGGTTLHWLGSTPRMLPNDFKIKTLYGHGVDWPISYEVLKPYYEMAENEIGVAANVEELVGPNMTRADYGADYMFPMEKIPQSYLDEVCIKKIQDLNVHLNEETYTINCVSTPQGRNSTPNKKYPFAGVFWDEWNGCLTLVSLNQSYEPVGSIWNPYSGQRCEGNSSCVPICPVQAKYNALKSLKKADTYNLEIRTQSVASKVLIDPKTQQVTGIAYKQYEDKDSTDYQNKIAKGKLYVLAANAIENAKLLLASNAANSSDQVGRNLMDHPVLLTWGLLPEKGYPFRGPGSTSNINTFREGDFRKNHSAWISPIDNGGWSWPAFSPGSDVSDAVQTKGLFGKALRHHLNNILTRQLVLHFECEQLPDPENRVTIDPKYLDALGNYRPVIQYDVNDYVKKAFAAARKVSKQIFKAQGVADATVYDAEDYNAVSYEKETYVFKGAGHLVGTHRMGSDPSDSVVNPDQRCWDHDNLYLIGCGNMPTLGTSNPTLTMTALTFMAAEAILKQLKKTHS